MEITVISWETIKPSSPTPHHLQHLKLSLFDQYMTAPGTFFSVLLFYSSHGDLLRFGSANMSHRLKKSLSEVVTEFYPLAGECHGNHSIHCSDKGLQYIEARVQTPFTLARLLSSPQADELNRLLPYDMYKNGAHTDSKLSAVQVTVFDGCGGMAIGICLSHIVGDALSLAMFLKSWAAVARGDTLRTPPKFGFASVFPPRDSVPVYKQSDYTEEAAGISQPNHVISKRFVFRQTKIDALKAKLDVKHCPTRVEAVSALLLKCYINAGEYASSKSIVLGTAINVRSRMSPPLAMHHFGNFALPWTMKHTGPVSLSDLAVTLKEMIREVDYDCVDKLQANNASLLSETLEGYMKLYTMNDVRVYGMVSWCKFPFYDVDIGWGAPTWAAPCYPNDLIIGLIDARDGDGIEAWVTLEDDAMGRFESDKELVEFACFNPAVVESFP